LRFSVGWGYPFRESRDFPFDGLCGNPSDGKESRRAARRQGRVAVSSQFKHFVAHQVKANVVGAGLIEIERRNRVSDVGAKLFPVSPLRENILSQALGAIAAVGFLGDLKNYFFHTLTLNL
jgi:hypothetical protein